MQYYSINNRNTRVDFKTAALGGQAPDGGLYFPEHIPSWEKGFVTDLKRLNKTEIGFRIMKPYVGGSMKDEELFNVMAETLDFEFPLQKIHDNIYSLELFHGPTLAFKDLGARFLSRCLGIFSQQHDAQTNILVATSGDTGGAVADAFHGVRGTTVFILYPSGKVSPVQEKQLTTHGGNIHAFEVEGDFDDCQRMVKEAFRDQELMKMASFTSSNSINIARWLSQQVYYALAYAQWDEEQIPVVSVPSGNFGNICAGLTARRSGLPIEHFIAACNANNAFTDFIKTGTFNQKSSIATYSNAMDVGAPSNFIRILELFQHEYHSIKKVVSSQSISDEETLQTIKTVFKDYQYILDPHSAVAYTSLEKYLQLHEGKKGILLGTAHPIKFPDTVENAIGKTLEPPPSVMKILTLEKKSISITADYQHFKKNLQKFL
ncbi:MAG: threonine synthase [Chitinophagia bacterium]